MHSGHALSGPGHVWKPLQRSRLLSPFQKLVSWICPNNHSLFTLLPYLQLGSCWGIRMTRLCVLFGEGGPEESHSYRLTPQAQCSPCAERHIPGEAMPLPLTLAFAAEQALTGILAWPARMHLHSYSCTLQHTQCRWHFICWGWFVISDIFFSDGYLSSPCKGNIFFFFFVFWFFSLFFSFSSCCNILKAINSRVFFSENRSKFQHTLLLFSFRTILFQPSDLQQTA